MKITRVELFNFRCFDRKSISFNDEQNNVRHFTVLIGDNAIGKTTILEAVAKAFVPVLRPINKNVAKPDDFKDITDSDIRTGKKWTAIELEVNYEGTDYSWHNHRRISSIVEMKEVGELKSQKLIKDAIIKNIENENEEKKTPLVIYYSINRMFIDIPRRRSSTQTGLEAKEALDHAFATKNDFRRFYNWFKNEEENELRMHRSNKQYKSIKLNAVRNAINSVMEGYKNLRIEVQPSRMVMDDSNGNEFNVMHLSGGYKAIFSLVCDIASRLSLAYPNKENPLNAEALILIDELDLHLHPKWQKTIVEDLKRTFPNCQFVVTTHSPFIIQSLRKDEVINLESEDGSEKQIGTYNGYSIDDIQQEMGVEVKTPRFLEQLIVFNQSIDENNIIKAKSAYENIKNMIPDNDSMLKMMRLDMIVMEEDK